MSKTTHMQCNVCGSTSLTQIYDSQAEQSLTSLCQLHPGATVVWFCENCGHILSKPLEHTAEYYASDYKILLNHDDEDQIYEVVDGVVKYRTAHQLSVLSSKVNLSSGQKILDYGCAKAGMTASLLQQIPSLDFHFFDVSEMYRGYWDRLTTPDKCAVDHTPEQWIGRFDVVTSYFSFEHIPAPRLAAKHIASLLKANGVFYAIVPDTFGNVADFVVVDHVNHFTSSSIVRLLRDAGFCSIDVDAQSHRGALVIVARKLGQESKPHPIQELRGKVDELSAFWTSLARQISKAEDHNAAPAAIYGSGFYGAFIYAHLKCPAKVLTFLDQSPFQQGRQLFDVPIVAPTLIPDSIRTLYVGLNPKIARQVIASQPALNHAGLEHVFLDAPT